MSQALHTSSTGINSGQQQIKVIANNVANINTTAFKSANMTFETLYSRTLSTGSAATKDGGGTNPKQIGYGVKIGGITRNFDVGTFVSTGRNLDTMISGNGFYVVQDAGGAQYFTRDGIFSVDSNGNLVTQSGMKVVAAKSTYSNAGSEKTVQIPKNMNAEVEGDSDMADKPISSLNNASITEGQVAASVPYEVTETYTAIEKDDDGNDVEVEKERTVTKYKQIKVDIPGGDGTVSQILSNFTEALGEYATFTDNKDGTISYELKEGKTFEFTSEGTTSNFLAETGWTTSKTSYELNKIVKLQDVVNYNSPDTISLSDVAIDENGTVIATYSDGSILTQLVDDTQAVQWKYTTPEGVVISGGDVIAEGSSIRNASFTVELATMINQEGLISQSNNLWKWGPDVGDVYYGMAGEMAFGAIESGGYEESNVDIATELTNMISAQRMIQMNSRVFSTASSVMETLAYLGS